MAQDEIIRLVGALESDKSLLSQMAAASSPDERAAVASNNGFNVTAQEFKSMRDMQKGSGESELADGDLAMVAGGSLGSIWRYGIKKAADALHAMGL